MKMQIGDKVKIIEGKEWPEYVGHVGFVRKDYRDGDFAVNLGGHNTISITAKQLVKEK